MRRRVLVLPEATRDLELISDFLDDEAGPRVAKRFRAGARSTAESLCTFPNRGKAVDFDEPALRQLRWWPISGFPSILLYYRVLPGAIEVVRVLHSARDIRADLFE